MKIDFDTVFNNLEGETLDYELVNKAKQAKTVPLTLKTVCTNALLGTSKSDENEDGASKAVRYSLAILINKGGKQDLTAEEIVLTKKKVGLSYSPLIVGQAYLLLDGK
jgi:hypothetical protein